MHIRENEATDSIDWEYFYAKYQEDWYVVAWNLIHDTAANIPCSTCREEAVALFKALHDLVTTKVHPERELFDQKNFLEIADLYTGAAKHLRAEGTEVHPEHEIEA